MKRILLVDDDPDILDALSDVLEDSYEILLAQNGKVALEVVEQEHPDAIVLDLMMPIMDGVAFAKELRRRGFTMPIILASAGRDVEKRTVELGAYDFVSKPFELEDLEKKLAAALGGSGGAGTKGGSGAPDGSGESDEGGVEGAPSLGAWGGSRATPTHRPAARSVAQWSR